MTKHALAFDPSLVNHWVIVWQTPDAPADLLPVGGPLVAWLFWNSWDKVLVLEVECAVFVARDSRVTRVGPPPRRRDGSRFTLGVSRGVEPQPLPEDERIRLGLPERPDTHLESQHDHDAAPAALHTHGLQCLAAGDLAGAELHLRTAVEWSRGEAFYRASLATFYTTQNRHDDALALQDPSETSPKDRM